MNKEQPILNFYEETDAQATFNVPKGHIIRLISACINNADTSTRAMSIIIYRAGKLVAFLKVSADVAAGASDFWEAKQENYLLNGDYNIKFTGIVDKALRASLLYQDMGIECVLSGQQ